MLYIVTKSEKYEIYRLENVMKCIECSLLFSRTICEFHFLLNHVATDPDPDGGKIKKKQAGPDLCLIQQMETSCGY